MPIQVLVGENANSDVALLPSRPFSPHSQSTEPSTALDTQSSHPSVHLTITHPKGSTPKSYYEDRYVGIDNGVTSSRQTLSHGQSGNTDDSSWFFKGQVASSTMERGSSSSQKLYPRQDRRSIFLSNLSDRTMHKDIVSIIRGGALLDIYARSDHQASIAFVDGAAAQAFMDHTKRNDIYLHDKRVSDSKRVLIC